MKSAAGRRREASAVILFQVKDGISRINVKLQSVEGTEINGKGPVIRKEEKEEIMKKLDLLQRGDTLVLAGSVPQGMPESIYSEMLSYLQGREILTVVDTTGPLLLASLAHHPFLIKPNNHELGELFGVRIEEREQVIPYAKKLQERGARNVLVSLAGKGAVLAAEDGTVCSQMPPRGELVNVWEPGIPWWQAFWQAGRVQETTGRLSVWDWPQGQLPLTRRFWPQERRSWKCTKG